MFRVGQKVVCVRAREGWLPPGCVVVSVGDVYTIRDVGDLGDGGVGLRVEEITNPTNTFYGVEYGYWANRFRPVVKRKTDISALQALLAPTAKKLAGVE